MRSQPSSSERIESLQKEILRLESLFENSSLNYQCLDSKGTILKINSSWLNTLGYSENEVLNNWFGEFLEPKSVKKFEKNFANLTQPDTLSNLELKMKCKDGSLIYTDFSCLGTTINGDSEQGTHCVFQNITKLRQTELALAESEKKYSQLVELANVGIFEMDPYERRYTYVNDIIKRAFGIEDSDLHSFKMEDNLTEEGKAIYNNRLDSLVRGEEISNIAEYQIIRGDMPSLWVQINYSYIQDANKKIRIIGVAQDITSRKNTEQRYKALVDSASPGISTMSKAGFLMSVNPRLCEISGYNEDELVGKHYLKIPAFLPKDAPKYIKLYNDARKGKIPEEPYSFQWKHKDGTLHWGEGFLSKIKQEGKLAGYQAVLTDTTNRVLRQEAEKQQRETTGFLYESALGLLNIESEKDLYDFLTDKVMEILPKTVVEITSSNEDELTATVESIRFPNKNIQQRFLNVFGNRVIGMTLEIPRYEVDYATVGHLFTTHQSVFEIVHGKIPRMICNQIEKILGKGTYYEIFLGSTEIFLGSAIIFSQEKIELPKQKIIEILFREASSTLLRMRALKRLDRREKLYRSLAESTGDWIIRFNPSFEHIFVNKATGQAFNMSPEEFLGKKCIDLGYSPEYSKLIENKLNQTIIDQRPTQCDIELCIDKQTDFYEWCFYPEIEESGMVSSVLVNARNISQRKRMEGEMLDTISKKNSLYSIISHDLRSPFNSILGFLNLLQTNYHKISEEKKREYIKIAHDSAEGCLALLNQLLEWSSDYQDKESIKPLYFDFEALVTKVIELNKANILEKNIRVVNEVKADTLVHADYNMIFTVLRNLFSNSLRFSNENGIIIISATDQKSNVICKVQDFGPGMSKDEISRLFANFQRKPSFKQKSNISFGMGLKLSKEFVENNDGEMWIEGEPGKGTSVLFTLNK